MRFLFNVWSKEIFFFILLSLLSLVFSLFLLFLFSFKRICLFYVNNGVREKQRQKERPSIQWLQWPGMDQVESRSFIWISSVWQGPRSWNIFCCFLRCTTGSLYWKWSNRDSNHVSVWDASTVGSILTCYATIPTPIFISSIFLLGFLNLTAGTSCFSTEFSLSSRKLNKV